MDNEVLRDTKLVDLRSEVDEGYILGVQAAYYTPRAKVFMHDLLWVRATRALGENVGEIKLGELITPQVSGDVSTTIWYGIARMDELRDAIGED